MKVMTTDELRRLFLDYFREKGHTVVPSASLVPEGDPTLLFNVAGMVQFKQFYACKGEIPFTRAASVQKCLRATDLEEVGRTIKHHTFFEMLGNFSFGDYFKREAIEWAWDFLTNVVKLPVGRLVVSVHVDDGESEKIWVDSMGVDKDRVYRLGDEENFWGPAGASGPCGPCSEIHYDFGPEAGCGKVECDPACDCGRFIEVWNLVFPQFYQDTDGSRGPLERKGVDTGMGLERLAVVCQGADSLFDTDVFKPIIEFIKDEVDFGDRGEADEVNVRVIADHARALCFAISEGALPSNEGRGYVIRRILRRAVVKALNLGQDKPFLYRVAGRVIDVMRGAYPELDDRREQIAIIIKSDEERFQGTLQRGMSILNAALEEIGSKGGKEVPGATVFKLYDTYGFPVEITHELASNAGLGIDAEGFEREMEEQRERARQASKIGRELEPGEGATEVSEAFVGYDLFEVPTVIKSLGSEPGRVTSASADEEVDIELDRTPFYPECGGQVADVGTIVGPSGKGLVVDVRWFGGTRIMHRVLVEHGTLSAGDGVVAKIDLERRKDVERNHTATHLLHAALRSVLGGHVRQAGSLVAPDRLRFDFTHYEPVGEDELRKVESIVNEKVLSNVPVGWSVMAYEDARARGAVALFGEKYGQQVRMVEIENSSCELCGGTHVTNTGEIGLFRIASESGIAAGVRRIEALTGHAALEDARAASRELQNVSAALKVPARELEDAARRLSERVRALEKELSEVRQEMASGQVDDLIGRAEDVDGMAVVSAEVAGANMDLLKHLVDRVRDKLPSGVICLGSGAGGRAVVVVSVDQELVDSRGVKASFIAKKIGEMVGGKGGGKDTFAQAGGKDPGALGDALKACREVVADIAG
jgi:alanyl-tRNA synthetase